MEVVFMGNIAATLTAHIAESLPYVEDDILKAVVKQILPDMGIVISASREELRDNPALGGVMYNKVTVKKVD